MNFNLSIICIYIFAISSIFAGCKNKYNQEIRDTLESIQGKELHLPLDSMVKYESFIDTISINTSLKNKYTTVCYIDMNTCLLCEINALHLWNDYILSNSDMNFVFIVSPNENDSREIISAINNNGLYSPIYFDTLGIFRKQNRFLPKEPLYNTMLLDSLNTIQLIGNPVKNKRIFKLTNKLINKL